jgi:hypothetical protein
VPITLGDVGVWTLYAAIRDTSGVATFYKNGAQIAGGWADGPLWLQLGSAASAATDISIAEVVVYTAPLTTAARHVVEGYTCQRMGICTLLPPGHPYYVTPSPAPSGYVAPTVSVTTTGTTLPVPPSKSGAATASLTATVTASGAATASASVAPSRVIVVGPTNAGTPSAAATYGFPTASLRFGMAVSGLDMYTLGLSPGARLLLQLRLDWAALLSSSQAGLGATYTASEITVVAAADNSGRSDVYSPQSPANAAIAAQPGSRLTRRRLHFDTAASDAKRILQSSSMPSSSDQAITTITLQVAVQISATSSADPLAALAAATAALETYVSGILVSACTLGDPVVEGLTTDAVISRRVISRSCCQILCSMCAPTALQQATQPLKSGKATAVTRK